MADDTRQHAASATCDEASPSSIAPWPFVIIDDANNLQIDHAASPYEPFSKRRRLNGNIVVENEVGLCDKMAACLQAIGSRKLPLPPPPKPQPVPLLAAIVRSQQGIDFPLQRVAMPKRLSTPLLFCSLVHNDGSDDDAYVEALGVRWLIPPRSAFSLCHSRRWHELAPLRPPGGYRLISLDPPWHSKSRGIRYETSDKKAILADLVPAIEALACKTACLLAVWITNNRAVQDFVEEVLFPRCGAAVIGRWYWAKLAADGSGWASGGDPYSPHRKPWEPLVLGLIGGAKGGVLSGEATRATGRGAACGGAALPLARRLVVCSVPRVHSAKPSLDGLLSAAAPQLLGRPDLTKAEAWRLLPKLECYAREAKQEWHAIGNEALKFQRSAS